MNRKVLDVFGTEASKHFGDFTPKLDPRYVLCPIDMDVQLGWQARGYLRDVFPETNHDMKARKALAHDLSLSYILSPWHSMSLNVKWKCDGSYVYVNVDLKHFTM